MKKPITNIKKNENGYLSYEGTFVKGKKDLQWHLITLLIIEIGSLI